MQKPSPNHARIFAATLLFASFAVAQTEPDNDTGKDRNPPQSQQPDTAMSIERLAQIVASIDPEFQQQANGWQFELNGRAMLMVADDNADRMRIMSPIISSAELDQTELYRLLQANFDSALDARYAVAQDVLWAVFVHPLSALDDSQVTSGIFQVYSSAETFGSSYSSGIVTYGGGDSSAELEKLREQIQRKLHPTT